MSPCHHPKPRGLTSEQQAAFERDGYLVIPAALPPSTVSVLLDETRRMLGELSLHHHPLTRFSTGQRDPHIGDDYFLSSGEKIRYFFEEDAFEDDGKLVFDKHRAINKIGHGLHIHSLPFRALLSQQDLASSRFPAAASEATGGDANIAVQTPSTSVTSSHNPADIARTLGFRDPRVLQSMIICKQPEIGGAVPPHQDSTFLFTDPPSAVGFWHALEDANLANGCLCFLPGSHRWAPIEKRLVRKSCDPGNGTEMIQNSGSKFAHTLLCSRPSSSPITNDDYVPAEVKAGDLLLIHGNLLNKSERNKSQKGRIIYTFHIIETDNTKYDDKNWLQPPEEGFVNLYT